VEVPVENEVIKVQKDVVRVDMTVMKPVEKPKELKIIKHVQKAVVTFVEIEKIVEVPTEVIKTVTRITETPVEKEKIIYVDKIIE
jgi:hypothetical protein